MLAIGVPGKLPLPACIVLRAASPKDNTVFKEQIAPGFTHLRVFADKIFHDRSSIAVLKEQLAIDLLPCNKRMKGQAYLHADQKLFNTLVSKARQPIEAFFHWLQEKTAIQSAEKVRSLPGLLKHVFGRLAAALFLISF